MMTQTKTVLVTETRNSAALQRLFFTITITTRNSYGAVSVEHSEQWEVTSFQGGKREWYKLDAESGIMMFQHHENGRFVWGDAYFDVQQAWVNAFEKM